MSPCKCRRVGSDSTASGLSATALRGSDLMTRFRVISKVTAVPSIVSWPGPAAARSIPSARRRRATVRSANAARAQGAEPSRDHGVDRRRDVCAPDAWRSSDPVPGRPSKERPARRVRRGPPGGVSAEAIIPGRYAVLFNRNVSPAPDAAPLGGCFPSARHAHDSNSALAGHRVRPSVREPGIISVLRSVHFREIPTSIAASPTLTPSMSGTSLKRPGHGGVGLGDLSFARLSYPASIRRAAPISI
jgi:hypothetical protein